MDKNKISQAISQYETPFYIFDTDAAVKQIEKLKKAFGENVKICYAMKANPFIIKPLQNTADYFEVCSQGELHICERANIPMGQIVLSGVVKKEKDLIHNLNKYGGQMMYTIESLTQWNTIQKYAAHHKQTIHVLLRLTNGSQFGLDEDLIEDFIAKRHDSKFMMIDGVQFFPGTQKKSPEKLEKELQRLDEFLLKLQEQYHYTAKRLEYGPGLPICYFEHEKNMEDTMLHALAKAVKSLKFKGEIVLEIGRYLAAPCGYFVTNVLDVKRNQDKDYGIVDGGMHHLNYYGQMLAMKTPSVKHLPVKQGQAKEWTICGSLCTMNDVLLKEYPFVNLEIGDSIVFEKAGAYSITECMALFLSHNLPQVILYTKQRGFCLVREHLSTDVLNGPL